MKFCIFLMEKTSNEWYHLEKLYFFLLFCFGNNYALGQNSDQQCYIVGYDEVTGANVNCPRNPHHRSSQCPAQGDCNEHDPNPNTWKLYGAVVGGPDEQGVFVDDRTRYELTEVATDYNSGYQGLLAALIQGVGQ